MGADNGTGGVNTGTAAVVTATVTVEQNAMVDLHKDSMQETVDATIRATATDAFGNGAIETGATHTVEATTVDEVVSRGITDVHTAVVAGDEIDHATASRTTTTQ